MVQRLIKLEMMMCTKPKARKVSVAVIESAERDHPKETIDDMMHTKVLSAARELTENYGASWSSTSNAERIAMFMQDIQWAKEQNRALVNALTLLRMHGIIL